MANIFTVPTSGFISFDNNTFGGTNIQPLSTSPRLMYDGKSGLTVSCTTTSTNIERFSVEGSMGRLFTVTDVLTGNLFTVSDSAGLPVLEVSDNDTVVMGEFDTNTLVVSGKRVGIGNLPIGTNVLSVSGDVVINGNITGDLNVLNNEINISGNAASSLLGQRYGLNLTNLDSFDPGQPLTVDGRARIVHGMTFQAGINNFTNGSDHSHVLWAAQNRNLWQMIQNGGNSAFDRNFFTLTTVGYNSTLTFFNEANIYSIDTTTSTIGASFPFALSNVRISFNTNQTPNLMAGDYVSIGFNPGAAGIVANTYTGTVASGPTSVIINGATRFQYTFTLNMFNTLNWVDSSKGLELVSVNASGNKNVRVSTSPETLMGTKVSLEGNYNNIPRFVLVTMNGHNAYEGESVVFNNLVSLIGISVGQWNAYVRHVINANQFVISIGNPIGGYVSTTGTTTNTADWFIVKGSTDAIHQYNAALQHLVIQRFPTSDTSTTTTGGNRAVALGNSAEVDGNFSYALGYKSTVTGNRSAILGGENNYVTGNNSSVLGGSHNSIQGNNIFTLGSNLTASVANTTYVNNLSSDGSVFANTFRVGNRVSATGPVGTIVGKYEIFNSSGTSLGFVPIYNSIT